MQNGSDRSANVANPQGRRLMVERTKQVLHSLAQKKHETEQRASDHAVQVLPDLSPDQAAGDEQVVGCLLRRSKALKRGQKGAMIVMGSIGVIVADDGAARSLMSRRNAAQNRERSCSKMTKWLCVSICRSLVYLPARTAMAYGQGAAELGAVIWENEKVIVRRYFSEALAIEVK